MDFYKLEDDFQKQYEWCRAVSGSWHHWVKRVLGGEIILHVEGSEEAGGYWGSINTKMAFDDNLPSIYSTRPEEGLHVPFRTPENCAMTIDNIWKSMIQSEEKLI